MDSKCNPMKGHHYWEPKDTVCQCGAMYWGLDPLDCPVTNDEDYSYDPKEKIGTIPGLVPKEE